MDVKAGGTAGTGQIKSKKRVTEHGEVFTAEREVNAMLDLVADECLRAEARFLEPACGDGNFLAAILKRKLSAIRQAHYDSPLACEEEALNAISSLYGIDIMSDNVELCRERLFVIWNDLCGKSSSEEKRQRVRAILRSNIVNGNTLTHKLVDSKGNDTAAPIPFLTSRRSPIL